MGNKKYIYNMKQANFFIEQGCRCVGIGKHSGTGKMYFMFDYDECQPAYELWNSRSISKALSIN